MNGPILEEKDARERWCFQEVRDRVGKNTGPQQYRCIASGCMAWVVERPDLPQGGRGHCGLVHIPASTLFGVQP